MRAVPRLCGFYLGICLRKIATWVIFTFVLSFSAAGMGGVCIPALSVSAVQLLRHWSLRYNIVLGEGRQGGRREGNDWDKQGDKIRVVFCRHVLFPYERLSTQQPVRVWLPLLWRARSLPLWFRFECLKSPHAMCSKEAVEANLPLGFRCPKINPFYTVPCDHMWVNCERSEGNIDGLE